MQSIRTFAKQASSVASSSGNAFRILVVGAGSAGIATAAQLGKALSLKAGEIGIIDGSSSHVYQPGWTLVGANVASMPNFSRRMSDVIPAGVSHIPSFVSHFSPDANSLRTVEGRTLFYDYLIVAPGIQLKPQLIKGLGEALEDSSSGVSSVYFHKHAEKLAEDVGKLHQGKAIFTQPQGIIKCAGAPSKVMWKSLQRWLDARTRSQIDISFITGMPTMFSVPKYSKILDELRKEHAIEGLFNHDLISVDRKRKIATFKHGDSTLEKEYDLLHVAPKMGPYDFVAKSALADTQGFVEVDPATLQHKRFENVFSLGDASSLPTSKTVAAITSQIPVLVHNLKKTIEQQPLTAAYSGYTSCPLTLTQDDVLLAEFKYGLIPDETFSQFPGLDQSTPRKVFYQMKKNFFPWVYFNHHLKGNWYGRSGFFQPQFD